MRYLFVALVSGLLLVVGVFALIGGAGSLSNQAPREWRLAWKAPVAAPLAATRPSPQQPAGVAKGGPKADGNRQFARFVPVDTSPLMGSPDPLPPLAIEKAFPRLRFNRPLQVTHAGDGTNRIFVVTQEGIIYVFPNRPDVTEAEGKVFLDLSKPVEIVTNEEGLMSIAFHPKYRDNGRFFVYYTVRPLASVIDEYRVSARDPDRADPASRVEILRFDQPYGNHNGGSMQFGPDGYLYIGLGDGGAANDPHGHGQNLTTLLGSVLRIDVDRRDPGRAYAIPPDNPFVDRPDPVRKEIWAYGVRNIWRLSFDRLTGTLWAGDVGQDRWEEIDILVRGGNYGWNYREGSHPFRAKKAPPGLTLIDPIIDYSHEVGRSVTGGVVYRGKELPELYGAYLYADFVTGRIWALRYDGQKVTENKEIVVSQQLPISSFGEDEAGEVYFTAFDGHVYKFRRASHAAPASQTPFPRKLSETGLFKSVREMTPADGLIPYTVNVPLWSDGAPKDRYLALPRNRSVRFHPSGAWEFPVGTVLVKTFFLDQGAPTNRRRLETRLLVHSPRGWVGYTYLWNDEQTDAQLLDNALTRTYPVSTAGGSKTQSWYFPSRADCNACHTQAAGHVLGLNTRQLNRLHRYGQASENQLQRLDRLEIFTERLPQAPDRLEAYPDWESSSADTALLARAYLDANCAMCHQPGASSGTMIDVRFHTPLEETRLVNQPPGKIRIGPPNAKLLAPGRPEQSELLLRMKTRGEGQMPPLASFLPDQKAAGVVAAWIESLPADGK